MSTAERKAYTRMKLEPRRDRWPGDKAGEGSSVPRALVGLRLDKSKDASVVLAGALRRGWQCLIADMCSSSSPVGFAYAGEEKTKTAYHSCRMPSKLRSVVSRADITNPSQVMHVQTWRSISVHEPPTPTYAGPTLPVNDWATFRGSHSYSASSGSLINQVFIKVEAWRRSSVLSFQRCFQRCFQLCGSDLVDIEPSRSP